MEPLPSGFPSPVKVTVELSVTVIDLRTMESEPGCPHCDQSLNLHQPDESLPTQLLATCDSCFRWFSLYELAEARAEFVMIELPAKSQLEDLHAREGMKSRKQRSV